ncbi:MAG: ATP-binding protein [Acidothermaceae bacterium]
MRKRLLISTLLVAMVAVVLLGVPLGIVAGRLIRDEAHNRMNREAAQIATGLDQLSLNHQAITAAGVARLTASDRYVVVTTDAQKVTSGKALTGDVIKGTAVGNGHEVVKVYASDADTTGQIATVWVVVAGLAVVALAAAVALARVQARRFGAPLEALAESAERLGSGDPRPRSRRSGIPELDKVGQVLDRSAERIADLLRAERALAADASHQLRTPLTALSIRLEEIIATAVEPSVRQEAVAALAATERLVWVVDSLLAAHARSSRPTTPEIVDIDEILDQQHVEWLPAFSRLGRDLFVDGRRGLKASATPGVLAQVVATLIDNAVNHGSGSVRLAGRHSGAHVVVDVSDEGPGVPDVVAPHIFERSFSGSESTGLGLSLARDLVEADGGRLELTQQRPPVFSIFLTSADT